VIDARGLYCPQPVFMTKVAIEKMNVGSVLKVLANDPAAEEDISNWVHRHGHQLLNIKKTDKDLEFTIKKV
jgi:tRNA 2-thiouridine synthesizing protein A